MLGWFLETTLVASGLAVVAALGGRLRTIGPTARHALWLVVLVKLVTPPLFCWPWAADWGRSAGLFGLPLAAPQSPTLRATADSIRERSLTQSLSIALAEPNRSRGNLGLALSASERGRDKRPKGNTGIFSSPCSAFLAAVRSDRFDRLTAGLCYGWAFVTLVIAVGQALRVLQFRGRLRTAVPAPEFLVRDAEQIGQRLGVRVPDVLVVPDLGTPVVWCLGEPKLLLPAHLVKSLSFDRWRAILTHELAHIRRGDHWVSRLELAAGLIWWWNPIYWLARARIDAEAELACDAWVIDILPKHRLAYAETLFNIFSDLSSPKPPVPALGAVGSGHFFERRLTMIVHGHASCRLSTPAFLAACLLVLLALPSWSTAKPVTSPDKKAAITSLIATVNFTSDDDARGEQDEATKSDDDEDDAIAKAKADIEKAEASLRKALDGAKKAKADAKKAKAEAQKATPGSEQRDVSESKRRKMIDKKSGRGPSADFQKEIEELGEKIEKEIEGKFGPDFQKKMEELGEHIGKEIESKLGSGSEFEKKMKEFGKDMEAKFGPGSEFEKKMKALGKDMEAKFGPGSEFEKAIKQQAEKVAEFQMKAASQLASRAEASASGSAGAAAKSPAAGNDRQRERRIAAIEEQIRKLADELKALKDNKPQD